MQSITPWDKSRGLGSFPFARRYSGNRCFFLFLRLLRCFTSPGSLPYVMDWRMDDSISAAGFPHSDIPGSMDICSSPRLFAAYHVFHRLLVPRHPPCALLCLIASQRTSLRSVRVNTDYRTVPSLLLSNRSETDSCTILICSVSRMIHHLLISRMS